MPVRRDPPLPMGPACGCRLCCEAGMVPGEPPTPRRPAPERPAPGRDLFTDAGGDDGDAGDGDVS